MCNLYVASQTLPTIAKQLKHVEANAIESSKSMIKTLKLYTPAELFPNNFCASGYAVFWILSAKCPLEMCRYGKVIYHSSSFG